MNSPRTTKGRRKVVKEELNKECCVDCHMRGFDFSDQGGHQDCPKTPDACYCHTLPRLPLKRNR